MKWLVLLCLIAASSIAANSVAAQSDCPNYTNVGESYLGCPLLHKEVTWTVSWPTTTDSMTIKGDGLCCSGNVCCDSTVRTSECWPAFYTPTASNGTFSQ